MEQLKAAVRFLQSFVRREWSLQDYPLRVMHRSAEPLGRLKPYTWTVQVINWWHMRGDGYSREEAFERLREAFLRHKAKEGLPRPGRGHALKVEFAATTVVDSHSDVVRDLLERVIGLDPDGCLVTDESSLWDFHDGESNEALLRKISLLYGVDVSGVNPPTLARIAVRIKEARGTS